MPKNYNIAIFLNFASYFWWT